MPCALAVSLTTVHALGLTIPPILRMLADEVMWWAAKTADHDPMHEPWATWRPTTSVPTHAAVTFRPKKFQLFPYSRLLPVAVYTYCMSRRNFFGDKQLRV
jgi:hypothetical protein